MVKIKKININNKHNTLNMNLVSLNKDDIQTVRHFILEQHEKLERKDFFIIEDLDSELPLIFEENKGAIYGISFNEQLIAIQALDFSGENDSRLRPLVQTYLKNDFQIYEMGWTLVDSEFRGYHLAKYLVEYIEEMIRNQNCILLATVHPENVIALKLYLKIGYKGYNIMEYYGYSRMFLIKTPSRCEAVSKIHIECGELIKIRDALCNQYFCENIVEKGGKMFMEMTLAK